MASDALKAIEWQLKQIGRVDALDVYIRSFGGHTETPWAIVQELRNFADTLGVLVGSRALSAATHLALGANEIVMSRIAFLGPLDPARQHPLLERAADNTPLQMSVQDLKHAVSFVLDQSPQELTPDAFAIVVAKLFDRVHPLAIGGIEQSYALGKRLSRQLLGTHMSDRDRIDAIADALSDDFKSHSYLIGRREAAELGLPIVDATEPMEAALDAIEEYYARATDYRVPFDGGSGNGANLGPGASLHRIVCVDSVHGQWDCAAVGAPQLTQPLPPLWQLQP